jgi:hypothetical protein
MENDETQREENKNIKYLLLGGSLPLLGVHEYTPLTLPNIFTEL